MNFLLSNDDGIDAPGIAHLEKAVEGLGDITLVAPDRDHSGASNSLSLKSPIVVERITEKRIKVFGTPTDCVHLALTGLLEQKPDMVLSGINLGANLGDDVWYSGTVAAAIEGRFLGLPSIAFSLCSRDVRYLADAEKVAADLVRHVLTEPLESGTVLNVNIPACRYEDMQGFELVRLGCRHVAEPLIRDTDSGMHELYWIGAAGKGADAGPGTDFYAIEQNKIAISPLRIDLTHHEACAEINQWMNRWQ
ncbi:MAG: 5'/3'-nucleotidase SurE [Coxiellaceae bacterium]|nr:5'/3'-nucleotidase SurE [Coxiellaceae bacterium]